MKQTANHLLEVITKTLPLLERITEAEAAAKPAPNKWSAKEIIGHLIDSACNNQQKLIRTIGQPELQFVGYEQDNWVASQHYNEVPWPDLLAFWQHYNRHIAHIIANIPESALKHTISINNSEPFTLEFIARDYPEHQKHHLKAILPDANFLDNDFKTVY